MTIRRLLAAAAATLAVTGCSNDPEKTMQDQEEVATAARAEVDALAAKLGTDAIVKQDTLTDCIPGDRDSGKSLIYTLHIKVEPGTLERARTEIAAEYEADGWIVRQDSDGVRFLKGAMSIGATIAEAAGGASVGGSGGCVK